MITQIKLSFFPFCRLGTSSQDKLYYSRIVLFPCHYSYCGTLIPEPLAAFDIDITIAAITRMLINTMSSHSHTKGSICHLIQQNASEIYFFPSAMQRCLISFEYCEVKNRARYFVLHFLLMV